MLDIKYPEIKINSFAQFVDEINKHAELRRIEPRLFRGQSNKKWNITSTIHRHLFGITEDISPTSQAKELSDAINQHLAESRIRQASYPEMRLMGDFELLAEIQHMGGVSPFIDYSANPLIALFFACANAEDADGSISTLTPFINDGLIEMNVTKDTTWDTVIQNNNETFFGNYPEIITVY